MKKSVDFAACCSPTQGTTRDTSSQGFHRYYSLTPSQALPPVLHQPHPILRRRPQTVGGGELCSGGCEDTCTSAGQPTYHYLIIIVVIVHRWQVLQPRKHHVLLTHHCWWCAALARGCTALGGCSAFWCGFGWWCFCLGQWCCIACSWWWYGFAVYALGGCCFGCCSCFCCCSSTSSGFARLFCRLLVLLLYSSFLGKDRGTNILVVHNVYTKHTWGIRHTPPPPSHTHHHPCTHLA